MAAQYQAKPAPKGDLGGAPDDPFTTMLRALAELLFPGDAQAQGGENATNAAKGPQSVTPGGVAGRFDLSKMNDPVPVEGGPGGQPPLPPGYTQESVQAVPVNQFNPFGDQFGSQIFNAPDQSPINTVPQPNPVSRPQLPTRSPGPSIPGPEQNPAFTDDPRSLGALLVQMATMLPERSPFTSDSNF